MPDPLPRMHTQGHPGRSHPASRLTWPLLLPRTTPGLLPALQQRQEPQESDTSPLPPLVTTKSDVTVREISRPTPYGVGGWVEIAKATGPGHSHAL